jgi:biotin-dependent carboxylase-like uncharacterized protein
MSVPTQPRDVFEVLAPGLLTTIQDAGRTGHRDEGVPPSGACDPVSLVVANRLAGNPPGAPVLECTLLGPELLVLADVTIALAGADLGATAQPSGRHLGPGQAHRLAAGERLSMPGSGESRGCRAYLAVAGGFDVPVVLGSRSTSLVGGFGGLEGRALRTGDRLAAGSSATGPGGEAPRGGTRLLLPHPDAPVRVLPAPSLSGSGGGEAARASLCDATWGVSPVSDRRGLRLVGPPIAPSAPSDGGSHGVIPGTVQLSPDGAPLVLLADAGTTGGYPVIAVVISADLDIVGQARPGGTLRFQQVDLPSARRAFTELRRTLSS